MRKGLLLLSSGIDSPVAGYLMMKKDVEIICLHFDNQPLVNDKPLQKVKSLLARMSELAGKKIKIYVAPHGPSQVEIIKKADRRFQCVLCRRLMFKVAERIARKENCDFIITGENLSQVASQTLKNLTVADKAVKMMILRPLLTFDKQETIDLAKEIGTFDISIEAGMCCSAVPPNPATRAKLEIIEEQEKRVGMDKLVDGESELVEVLD
jgi:thiamine biosynthesis protein ThiI